MDIWDKRRRNLSALMAIKGIKGSQAARMAGLSVNTINKFLRGETHSLRWDSLEQVCKVLGLNNPVVLDADNPFSDTKNKLYELIDKMSEDEAQAELDRLLNQT